jgi:hypothetical protein
MTSILRTGLAKRRAWRDEDQCMRALADLDDDQLVNLSEAGRRLRRVARWRRARAFPGEVCSGSPQEMRQNIEI